MDATSLQKSNLVCALPLDFDLSGHPKPANASEVTTDSSAPERSAGTNTTSTSEPYREIIEVGLSHGRNAMSIWQELVDQHGFTGAYEGVKRFVRKLRGTQSPEARAIIQTAVGEESQVDYGTGPMVRDPQTGSARGFSC